MNNANSPEVLAVVPLPSAEERRRRKVMLARAILVALDLVLAGEPLGLQSARDLGSLTENTGGARIVARLRLPAARQPASGTNFWQRCLDHPFWGLSTNGTIDAYYTNGLGSP